MAVFTIGQPGGGSYIGGSDYLSYAPSQAALTAEVSIVAELDVARLSLSHPLSSEVLATVTTDALLTGTTPVSAEVLSTVSFDSGIYIRVTHNLTAEVLEAWLVEGRLNPTAPPSRLGPNGIIIVTPRLYLADKYGTPIEDISDWADGGAVTYNLDAPIAATMSVRLRDRARRRHVDAWVAEWRETASMIEPYASWLLVTIHRRYAGGQEEEESLGLYTVDVPGSEIWPEVSYIDLVGKDAAWILSQDRVVAPNTAYAGWNMVQFAIDTFANAAAGLPKLRVPPSDRVFPADTTWDAGTSLLEIGNDALEGAGYYTAKPDTRGQLYSTPYLRLADLQPSVTFDGASGTIVVPPINLDPTTTRIRNHVVVTRSDPRSPVIRVERNAPETSPVAVSKIKRRISHYVNDVHIASEAAAGEMADRLIEEGASYYVRAKLTTLPTDAPNVRDAVVLNMTDRDNNPIRGVYGEKWWRSGWSMPLTAGAKMTHDLNRVTDFGV